MFPNSPFATPTSSFNHPVPLVGTDPDQDPLVCVSFNKSYLPYIVGALQQLLLQSTWATSDLNAMDLQQMRVFDLIYLFSVAQPCDQPCVNSGIGGDLMPLIRQNPTNACILEGSFDNITWVTIMDVSKCSNFGTNPGVGTQQPAAGGGTVKNCYTLNANSILNLGVPVSSGDVITLDVSGSGWDGTESDFGPLWRCPDGEQFIAGACIGFSHTSGGDPVPTANHMSTIISINGTFYSIMPSVPFTVPVGVSNVTPFIQVNDANIADNQGSYNVCVSITNNAPTTWTHTFDFTATNGSFVAALAGGVTPASHWVGGAGWEQINNISGLGNTDNRFYRTNTGTVINSITLFGTGDAGQTINIGDGDQTGDTVLQSGTTPGGAFSLAWSGNVTLTKGIRIDIFILGNAAAVSTATKLVVTGTGTDPF